MKFSMAAHALLLQSLLPLLQSLHLLCLFLVSMNLMILSTVWMSVFLHSLPSHRHRHLLHSLLTLLLLHRPPPPLLPSPRLLLRLQLTSSTASLASLTRSLHLLPLPILHLHLLLLLHSPTELLLPLLHHTVHHLQLPLLMVAQPLPLPVDVTNSTI